MQSSAIASFEGGVRTTATVPNSRSGVTIGAGVDLAQNYESTLINWGMPSATAATGARDGYFATAPGKFGLQGSAATAALQRNGPFTVTAAVANTITNNAVAYNAGLAANGYGKTAFDNLSVPIQNALAEAVYNGGAWSSALADNPGLSTALQNQNWSQVASILQNNPNSAVKNAGNALAAAIKNGSVPATGKTCN